MEAVLFDLDNTLVNRRAAFETYAERFIDRFVTVEDKSERLRYIAAIRDADRNGYRKKKELYEELLHTLPIRGKSVQVEELLTFWFAEFPSCTVLMEGARETLATLREAGYKLGIVTNGSVCAQYGKIDHAGLRTLVDKIVVSDEVLMKKPDREIYEYALQQLDAPAAGAVFVGDHPRNDIHGAIAAGLQAVWLEGFTEWDDSLPTVPHSIKRLAELPEAITRLAREPGSGN